MTPESPLYIPFHQTSCGLVLNRVFKAPDGTNAPTAPPMTVDGQSMPHVGTARAYMKDGRLVIELVGEQS
jgi:hypothetical protein